MFVSLKDSLGLTIKAICIIIPKRGPKSPFTFTHIGDFGPPQEAYIFNKYSGTPQHRTPSKPIFPLNRTGSQVPNPGSTVIKLSSVESSL